MTSPSLELQTLVGDILKANADVAAIVGDHVYDAMPSSGNYPCITFGPSDYSPEDADCITARRETLQLDCWVQAQGRLGPAKQLVDAVKAALHHADAELPVNALVSLNVVLSRVFLDPDGVTGHGVVQVGARIEEL